MQAAAVLFIIQWRLAYFNRLLSYVPILGTWLQKIFSQVVLELRKKRPKSSDEWRKDLQENQYTSFIIILDNFTQFSKKGEKLIFLSFFSSSNATIKAEGEKLFGYIFF